MAQVPSGVTNFAPTASDFVIEAYSRVQIRPTSMVAMHWVDARMSANLMLVSDWANIGMPLLWKVQLIQIPLLPGVAQYSLPSNVVAPLDAYVRQYQTSNAVNFTPLFGTAAGSTTVIIGQDAHGLAANEMVYYPTPVAVGGIIIQGPHIVQQVFDANTYSITASVAAQTTAPAATWDSPNITWDELAIRWDGTGNAGQLPVFVAILGSSVITVTLPDHGYAAGQDFFCNVPTTIAGMTLTGSLTVLGVTDANTFTIQGPQEANGPATVTMNGGLVQAQTQAYNVDYIDFILYPLSRTDYASQPDKQIPYRPTTFWFQRLITPVITFWNVPDDNGPYVFNIWCMTQAEDVVIPNGVGVDLPQRWFEAFASGLAAKLARKYPPLPAVGVTVADLKQEAQDALDAALREDIERTNLYLQPGLSGYYR